MTNRKIDVGIIGTGWIGEIRAKVCASHPLVESVHIAEIDPAKLARVGRRPERLPRRRIIVIFCAAMISTRSSFAARPKPRTTRSPKIVSLRANTHC